jgi:hypothetical protein
LPPTDSPPHRSWMKRNDCCHYRHSQMPAYLAFHAAGSNLQERLDNSSAFIHAVSPIQAGAQHRYRIRWYTSITATPIAPMPVATRNNRIFPSERDLTVRCPRNITFRARRVSSAIHPKTARTTHKNANEIESPIRSGIGLVAPR